MVQENKKSEFRDMNFDQLKKYLQNRWQDLTPFEQDLLKPLLRES